jgi:hypothetical protein
MYQCPRCHATDAFEVEVTTYVIIVQPEDDPEDYDLEDSAVNGDMVWDDDHQMSCQTCGYEDVVRAFHVKA